MQDLEFTIQSGKLYMLQTRNGKRTGKAMVKVAVDMVAEGKLIAEGSGAARRSGQARRGAAPDDRSEGAADSRSRKGLPASPGAAIGKSCSPRTPRQTGRSAARP